MFALKIKRVFKLIDQRVRDPPSEVDGRTKNAGRTGVESALGKRVHWHHLNGQPGDGLEAGSSEKETGYGSVKQDDTLSGWAGAGRKSRVDSSMRWGSGQDTSWVPS